MRSDERDRQILQQVGDYYGARVREYGETARGVDWRDDESHVTRLHELLRLVDDEEAYSILDYGCGYGALTQLLVESGRAFEYQGYDVSKEMIMRARRRHATSENCLFFDDRASVEPADYTVASGIFNVRGTVDPSTWKRHVWRTLEDIAALSRKGFAFNALTSWADQERMRPDLYYADPSEMLSYCLARFSRRVRLSQDYGLFEFTLILRKEADSWR